MSDVYQLMNVSDVKEDSRAIVKILRDIKDRKLDNDLRLLNYYHEIPVSYPASVDHVEDDMVDMTVHQHQAAVMHHEKMTFLKSRHFPHDVIAKVFRADVNRSLAILSKFAYALVRAERRRFVRVKISEKIDVTFTSANSRCSGSLTDISVGGMSLHVDDNSALEINATGMLAVTLLDKALDIPGTLLKIVEEGGMHKYLFEIETTSRIENLISQFIFQRQLEIIRELKDSI
ncbi:MAG: hypothetical protein FD174_467 [Geobacteraceae bacterium]|nr:MAG: hypothetical protein FD174_467 [Geobacteraceae bacterium]